MTNELNPVKMAHCSAKLNWILIIRTPSPDYMTEKKDNYICKRGYISQHKLPTTKLSSVKRSFATTALIVQAII